MIKIPTRHNRRYEALKGLKRCYDEAGEMEDYATQIVLSVILKNTEFEIDETEVQALKNKREAYRQQHPNVRFFRPKSPY